MSLNIREFRPGEIITAFDINSLVTVLQNHDAQLQQLGSLPAGPITVPVLFGRTLGQARAILTGLSQPLTLGIVIDAFGNLVDAFASTTQSRIVLNQIPAAGTRTTAGVAVNLVVAAQSSGGGPGSGPTPPQITSVVPNPVRVGAQLEILGQNFAALHTENNVRIGGVSVTPSALSNVGSLRIIIPTGIPGVPAVPGQPGLAGVPILVITSGGQATTTCTVEPPSATQGPVIATFTPATAFVDQTVSIGGSNFSTNLANNQVIFDGIVAVPTSATTTQLVVRVPTNIPGLGQVGDDRLNVPIIVRVGDVSSPPASLRIRRL
jgi:hypothetical protein